MTIDRTSRVDRVLPGLLEELADARTPDYLEAAIERASSRPQRPAWTYPGRWLPMDITTSRVATPGVPWRTIGALALIALLIAAAVAVFVGSQRRLPAPFGIARNGLIALQERGDLYTVDPATGERRLLVGGASNDEWIGFTRDGTKAMFIRWASDGGDGDRGTLGIAGVERGDVTMLPGVVMDRSSWAEPTPDGKSAAIWSRVDGRMRISIVALDGSSQRVIDGVETADVGGLGFLAPDGRELAFVRAAGGIAALDVTTGDVRTIVPGVGTSEVIDNISVAPARGAIAYALQDRATGAVAIHVVETDGTGDKPVGHTEGSAFQAWPQWSPSGRYLLWERSINGIAQPEVLDTQTDSVVTIHTHISGNGAGKEWAPDESAVLAQRTNEDGTQSQQELWDIRTGKVTPVAWPSMTAPFWQRLAPD